MTGRDRFGPRIDARPVFGRVRADLGRTLAALAEEDWGRPTACAPWLVRDVVAHVLGDDLSRLSRSRDGHRSAGPAAGEPLPTFLHRFNQQWVDATARVSPVLLRDLLAAVTPQVLAYWDGVDLDALGEPVSWADPGPAPVWLDCAREVTEYWAHHHQILDATGRAAPADDEARHVVLDTFARALPLTLDRAAPAGPGPVSVVVTGAAGGRWTCRREPGGWRWAGDTAGGTTVTLDADTFWRLCTRGVTPDDARRRAHVTGDPRLADAALQIVSIIR